MVGRERLQNSFSSRDLLIPRSLPSDPLVMPTLASYQGE